MKRTATLFFLALLLSATTAFCQLPYYIVDIDIQTPEEDFLIPRAYSGSNPFVAFDIWDNNSAWSVSNNDWAFTFAYSYDQSFSEGGVILIGSNSDSNRVYFLGATQQLFKADEYWCEIVGVHTSGYKKTFASGKLIEIYSATAYTNVAELSGQIQWLGLPNLVQSNQMGNATWDGTNGWRFPDSGTLTNTLTKPTNTWVSGYVLASSDTGLTTYATASSGGGSGTLTNLIGTGGIVVTGGGSPEATIDGSAFATGTPLYAYTETDPVWESEKSGYATGTPLYAYSETDPVWSAASNGYAVVGPLTHDSADLDMTWDGSMWTNAAGWSSDGTNDISLGGWVLDPDEYIQTPLLADGYHSADIGFQTSGAFNYLSESYSRDGTTFEADPAAYDPFDGLPTIVRFFCPDLPPIGTNFYAIVTNLVINSYEYPANAIMTNDFLGVELRIRDSDESESPVRQDEFDAANEAIWKAVTNTYAPGVVGIDLDGNVLTFGSYWDAQQIEDALVFSFAGNPVFTLSNGGTVIVSVASFSFDGSDIDLRVVCSALLEPTPQWSTNMTDWTSYSTNDFTSTWPNLTNGIALLEFAAQTGETAAVYYRAIAAGTNAGPGTATLTVPLIVNGTITADGFIGDGSGLTGIVAAVTGGVNSAGGLVGDVEFSSGDNIEITTNGQALVFSSTGGGGDLTALSNDVLAAWATASNALASADSMVSASNEFIKAETDPVWESEKAAYATGTPLYVFNETDLIALADISNRFEAGYTVPAWNGAAITNLPGGSGSDTGAVQKTGDTMTGALGVSIITNISVIIGQGAMAYGFNFEDPSSRTTNLWANLNADLLDGHDSSYFTQLSSDLTNKVSKTGDTMTGPLIVNSTITADGFIGDGGSLTNLSETDPVWAAASGTVAAALAVAATGTPLYVETDPIWESEKSAYATGTPLYAYTETDPVYLAATGAIWTGINGKVGTGTWAVAASTTDYWSRVTATAFTAANATALSGKLGTDTWAAAASTTNYAARLNPAMTGTGTLNNGTNAVWFLLVSTDGTGRTNGIGSLPGSQWLYQFYNDATNTIYTSANLTPGLYYTLAAYQQGITNGNISQCVTVPASNTAAGAKGNWAVSDTNVFLYNSASNKWLRVDGRLEW